MDLYRPTAQSILRPAKGWHILFSLLFALILEMVPISRDWIMPDFVALVLVFWNIRQPRLVGMGAAWLLGLLTDIQSGSLLGEHALAYTLLSYFAITIHRRVLWFTVGWQTIHILPLFIAAHLITIGLRMMEGGQLPPWPIFLEPLLTVALWPVVQFILLIPQKLPESRDVNRPI